MATSKAQQKAVQKYVQNNYDRVLLTMPKRRVPPGGSGKRWGGIFPTHPPKIKNTRKSSGL